MKIGIIGAGNIGTNIARLAVQHGHEVMISNSRGPDTLSELVRSIGCKAGTVDEAGKFGGIVVATIPFKNYRSIPPQPLAGKILIDTMNYYPERDGQIPDLDNRKTTTSSWRSISRNRRL